MMCKGGQHAVAAHVSGARSHQPATADSHSKQTTTATYWRELLHVLAVNRPQRDGARRD